jgi:hypothetical protein
VAERHAAVARTATWERGMPIRLYLAGRTFDPETTQIMSIAFQGVWDAVEELSPGSWEAADAVGENPPAQITQLVILAHPFVARG